MGSHTNMVSRKNAMVINFARSPVHSRVSISFSCTISEIKNNGHSRRKSYEHGLRNGHILYVNHVQSRVWMSFSCTVQKIQNTGHSRRISP
ncbi:hypothetical protein BHE74_00045911 [Ensete ventricosum]|nr:hypothetical protein BHE74_00045911 [Ensete ventricosum]